MRMGTRAQGATSLSRQHGSLSGCKAHQSIVTKDLVTGLSMWCGSVAASFMAIATEDGTGKSSVCCDAAECHNAIGTHSEQQA